MVVTWAALVVVGAPDVVANPVLVDPALDDPEVVTVAGMVEVGPPAIVVTVGDTVVGTTDVTLDGAVVDDSDCAPLGTKAPRTVTGVTAIVTRRAAVTRRLTNRWFIGDIEKLVSETLSVNRRPVGEAMHSLVEGPRLFGESRADTSDFSCSPGVPSRFMTLDEIPRPVPIPVSSDGRVLAQRRRQRTLDRTQP